MRGSSAHSPAGLRASACRSRARAEGGLRRTLHHGGPPPWGDTLQFWTSNLRIWIGATRSQHEHIPPSYQKQRGHENRDRPGAEEVPSHGGFQSRPLLVTYLLP